MPAFPRVLRGVAEAWRTRRGDVRGVADGSSLEQMRQSERLGRLRDAL